MQKGVLVAVKSLPRNAPAQPNARSSARAVGQRRSERCRDTRSASRANALHDRARRPRRKQRARENAAAKTGIAATSIIVLIFLRQKPYRSAKRDFQRTVQLREFRVGVNCPCCCSEDYQRQGGEIGRCARLRIAKSPISKRNFSFQKTIDLRGKTRFVGITIAFTRGE